eukprot:g30063.t2
MKLCRAKELKHFGAEERSNGAPKTHDPGPSPLPRVLSRTFERRLRSLCQDPGGMVEKSSKRSWKKAPNAVRVFRGCERGLKKTLSTPQLLRYLACWHGLEARMALSGCNKSWALFSDFLGHEAPEEIEAFFSAQRPPGAVRVLVMRHAMGVHNTYAGERGSGRAPEEPTSCGIGSIVSEDAEINECGQAQADAVAEKLKETALRVIPQENLEGSAETAKLPAIVHPLCAEQTFMHSHVGRGNRGSTTSVSCALSFESPQELSRSSDFSVFDWKEVEAYCQKRRETESSFQRRAVRLKKWLGSLQDHWAVPLNVLLVCHGGIMQAAFDYQPHPPNCGFRVYDLQRTGVATHVARGQAVVRPDLLVDPAFEVLSVRRLPEKANGNTVFRVEVLVAQQEFFSDISENVLRERLHDPVKEGLSPELYEKYGLSGLFPSWWSWLNRARADLSIYIQERWTD